MSRTLRPFVVAVALLVAACASQSTPSARPTASTVSTASPAASAPTSPVGESADVIFSDADVVTMDDAHPSA